jgi:hypothetical protein
LTYSELVTSIQTYTENTFPATTLADSTVVSSTTQLNRFITQAEQRIYNSVQFPSLRKNVTGSVTTSNKYLSCPDDFLSTYSLAVIDASGNYEYLLNKDVSFIRQSYPTQLQMWGCLSITHCLARLLTPAQSLMSYRLLLARHLMRPTL